MDVLWERGEATVVEVHGEFKETRIAQSTVATLLPRLKDKGVAPYRTDDRPYAYYAAVAREQVRRSAVSESPN